MNSIFHKADSRGDADHGWLKSRHTFSFANYYNPERVNFGALRVINDDHVMGGKGFGQHSHKDMEIISIPLSGKLKHGDNMGNHGVITSGEIQVMSAGTGVVHSEMNGDAEEPVKFLQIWVIPNKKQVEPRYQQVKLADIMKPNEFNQILSPDPSQPGVWIHQDAWFHLGRFTAGVSKQFTLHNEKDGVYIFVIDGRIKVEDQPLESRDGFGVWGVSSIDFEILEESEVLLMEVPMTNS